MDLRDYLHKKRMKASVFARIVNYDPGYLRQITGGFILPGDKLKLIIEKATGGEVAYGDWPDKKEFEDNRLQA